MHVTKVLSLMNDMPQISPDTIVKTTPELATPTANATDNTLPQASETLGENVQNARDTEPSTATLVEEVTAVVVKPAESGIDGLYGYLLTGWVHLDVLAAHAAPATIHIQADGRRVATATASQPRLDVLHADGSSAAVSFEAQLPIELFDDSERVISLHLASGLALDSGKQTLKFVRTAAKERTQRVKGHVDAMRGMFLTGWAFDPENPGQPVMVELLSGNKPIARTQANLFRADLQQLKFGTGHCAFALRLPPDLFDDKQHLLTLRELTTGADLPGHQPSVPGIMVRGDLEGLQGSAVCGWIHVLGREAKHAVDLWIDGELVSTGEASAPRDNQAPGRRFVLGIPERFMDGRPHELMVCLSKLPGRVAAIGMLALPCQLTPSDALQRYAGTRHIRSYLQPIGPQRYESLREGLSTLARTAAQATTPEELAVVSQAVINMALGQEQVIRGFLTSVQPYEHITLPQHAAPKVSIVIPVHNKFATTYTCLASIAAAQCEATYEVIVVDDGSKDETLDIQDIVSNLTIVRHDTAQGFVGASNAGGAAARGDYVLMLNNDTEVMSGWLDALLDPFNRFEDVGMTGAKLIYPTGILQEAGGLVWGNGQPWNIGRNGNASDPRYNYVRQVDYLSGACVLLPTPLWRELKGFDTYFAPAYYEDTDLAFRVRAKGFKTVYTPFCEVIHYEGVSNGTSTSGSGLKRFQAINQPKFLRRWIEAYQHNGVLGSDDPVVMQDRGARFRVLVLDTQTLTPDLDAGSYSAMQEIRILQSLGFKVTFVPANMAYMGGYTEALQRMGVEVVYAPFYFSMNEVIEKRGKEFNLFYIARYGVAEQVIDKIRSLYPQAKVMLNIHDLHFLREIRESIQDKDQNKMQKAMATRDAELAVMRKVNLVLSYSEVEQAVILSHNLDSTRTHLCPWVVATAAKIPSFSERQGIAFLGGFGHRPNVEAVEWFVRDVMPLLRDRLPGVPFLIYGSKAPDHFKALACDDVILKGFAKTTEEVYDTARVFVAPLLTGAGIKGKVIGGFARGIPTVMTPTAAEGTGAHHGGAAMVCTEPSHWVESIASLYEDEVLWNSMSESCRALTRSQYSLEHGREVLANALHQVDLFPFAGKTKSLWPRVMDF